MIIPKIGWSSPMTYLRDQEARKLAKYRKLRDTFSYDEEWPPALQVLWVAWSKAHQRVWRWERHLRYERTGWYA